MLICHSCGAPVESKSKQCHRCRNAISVHTAVGLLEPETGGPLKVQLELQPRTLDSLIAADLINAASKSSSSRASAPVIEKKSEPVFQEHSGPFFQKTSGPDLQQNPGPFLQRNTGSDLQTNPEPDLQKVAEPIFQNRAENQVSDVVKPISGSSQSAIAPPDFFDHLPPMFKQNISTQDENGEESLDWQADAQISPFIKDKVSKSPFSDLSEAVSSSALPVEKVLENAKVDVTSSGFKGLDEAKKADRPSAPALKLEPENGTDIEKKSQESKVNGETFAEVAGSVETNKENAALRRSFSDQRQGKTNSLNVHSSWPLYLGVGLVVLFLLFKGAEAVYTAATSLMANSSNIVPIGGQASGLSGRWQFAARSNNDNCQGQMVIHQRGNQLFGDGTDNGSAHYKFTGKVDGNSIDLIKQYYTNAGFVGHPIELKGDVDNSSKQIDLQGEFNIDYMAGGKWRGKPVSIKGIWEAKLIQPLIEDESSPMDMPVLKKIDERPSSSFGALGNNLSKNGIWYVLIFGSIGWLAWHFASSLIGPDGWIGIWDKQKYIPPQFMKEHRIEKKQLAKPLGPGSLPLGTRWEWQFWQKYFFWIPKDLALPPNLRINNPHVLILGGGEKGKSRLMANMIAHDIESSDRAVVVVDSDGDLADLLLRWIAAHPNNTEIAKRTVIIDPTSNAPSPSFNPLELPENADMQNAASAIVHGFKAIYHEPPGSQNQWSPQTAHILRNAAMLLMANGKTLIDLPTLLQDNDFRDIMLEKIEKRKAEKVEFATLLETWGQYKRLARTEQWINWYEPILNRVGPTLINLRIRPILTQSQGDINLKQIIIDKKILIVKIPKGQLHDDANLLGSLIVTGLKQAAITLCTEGKVTDRTAAMYLDEFDNFIEKETLDAITTETKKFQLGFVGSTKTLQHMPEDFRNQIVLNMGTMCVFALSKKDGDMIGPQMFRVSGRKAKHRTLMNILNKVNTSPQFELISDEEKYNIDRILGQSEREFYAYRVGAVAGTFRMKCHEFNDVPDNKVDNAFIEAMYKNR